MSARAGCRISKCDAGCLESAMKSHKKVCGACSHCNVGSPGDVLATVCWRGLRDVAFCDSVVAAVSDDHRGPEGPR